MKTLSKTKQALKLMQDEGITAYEAATRMNVSKSLIYRAIATETKTIRCEHCNSVINGRNDL